MPEWKKSIFVAAIKARVDREQRTAEDIIQDYIKLTEAEKAEIIEALAAQ